MEKKSSINPELWQACAGPVVSLPAAGTHVVYFPQGHSEQVAASMNMNTNDAQIPNYPNLPSKLLCLLLSLTLHVSKPVSLSLSHSHHHLLILNYCLIIFIVQADPETDEVYAQMTLQPVPTVRIQCFISCYYSWLCLHSCVWGKGGQGGAAAVGSGAEEQQGSAGVLLQDPHGQRHQHPRRLLRPPPRRREDLPSPRQSSFSCSSPYYDYG